MRTTTYNEAAYTAYVDACKEVAGLIPGACRGYVRITPHAKAIGINKGQLIAVAKALGLTIANHGPYGTCAFLAESPTGQYWRGKTL